MRRRDFITLFSGIAAMWPLAVRAQTEHMRHIGILSNKASDDQEDRDEHDTFVAALDKRGWTLGRNLQIEYRWGAGNGDLYRKYAVELVAQRPDLLLAPGERWSAPCSRQPVKSR
jgi:putative ABC transport system substrate-binding protein